MDPASKKESRKPSGIRTILMLLNACVCVSYAMFDHNTNLNHPFFSAWVTALRMCMYSFAGYFIGNMFPVIGDLSIIGTLGVTIYQRLRTN